MVVLMWVRNPKNLHILKGKDAKIKFMVEYKKIINSGDVYYSVQSYYNCISFLKHD